MKLMNLGVLMLGTIASTSAFAGDLTPIKTCSTVLTTPDSAPIPTLIEVFADDGSLFSRITQTVDGVTGTTTDTAQISWNTVREGLKGDVSGDDLNVAELLIAHAMILTEDPAFEGAFSAGLDLKAIRIAKIYLIGNSSIGMPAIIEAKDALGNNLGSFFGGFLVSPCK